MVVSEREKELASIVFDITRILGSGKGVPVLFFKGEKSPERIKLVYEPPERTKSSGVESPHFAGENEISSKEPLSHERVTALPVNFRCTLCQDRLYPIRRFRKPGDGKIAVLHYTGSVMKEAPRPDRSDQYILGGEEEDSLFARMFKAAGLEIKDIHFQEFPACRFNESDSMPEDWNRRCANCLVYVEQLIADNDLKLVILTGPASYLLLSEEKARAMATSGEIMPLEMAGRMVDFLVIRSPAALLAYSRKREKLKSEGNQEAYQKILQEEKAVKTRILESLKTAARKVSL